VKINVVYAENADCVAVWFIFQLIFTKQFMLLLQSFLSMDLLFQTRRLCLGLCFCLCCWIRVKTQWVDVQNLWWVLFGKSIAKRMNLQIFVYSFLWQAS